VNMTELNLLAKMLRGGAGEKPSKRHWNCASDETIAAYVDSALGESARARVQEHLAGCAYCRSLVSDVVKQGRETDVPEAPAVLLERAHALVAPKPKQWAWCWGAATAAGVLASAAIAVMVLKTPQRLTLPVWPSPAVPVLMESKPAIQVTPSGDENTRKLKSLQYWPSILSPHPGSVVAREQLEFRWNAVPDSMYYQIRVMTPDGDLVWEGDSTATDVKLPRQLTLNSGKYYVSVSAILKNERAVKSSPVKFQVAGSE
jgi:hypothetical protein